MADLVAGMVRLKNKNIQCLNVRDLPASALLHADFSHEAIQSALADIEASDGIVLISPVYKVGCSGLMKSFLDLLPQHGFRGKIVLPLLMGGTIAHTNVIDHSLRPILQSMRPLHICHGCFILDTRSEKNERLVSDAELARLAEAVAEFELSLTTMTSCNEVAMSSLTQ